MIKLVRIKKEDTSSLAPMMKRAFDEDSMIHLGRLGGPPGYDDGSFIDRWFFDKNATGYLIYNDNDLIGGANLFIRSNRINILGCIFIDPEYENKGLGLETWKEIERMYPDTRCWKVETPIFSHRNHHFYINKCGFKAVAIENPKDPNEGQFRFEKWMKVSY